MQENYPMLSVEKALEQILILFAPLPTEQVPVLDALDRVLAADIVADMDIPPLANTAMDGYAVRVADTAGATPEQPRRLHVIDYLAAGYVRSEAIAPGTAVRIMTGAPVPPGTEAVIPFENVQVEGDEILVFKPIALYKNVRAAGEDVQAGQTVLKAGTYLRAQEIGMLAALGHARVTVHRRPRVAVLSTGDEIIDVDDPWQPGKIRDANGYTIASLVRHYGGEPVRLGVAGDTIAELTAKLRLGLDAGVDMLVTSGGVSMGDFDVVKKVLATEGEMHFWRVRMKPGKPLAFGQIQGVPLLGLPGNPVSSMNSFLLFGRAALQKMQGLSPTMLPTRPAILVDPIRRKDNRRHFMRVWLEEKEDVTYAHLTGDQGSGILLSMVQAQGLAVIPEEYDHTPPHFPVQVLLFD
ncbi:MAG: molybdopterin molybdotransferase MoeA [Chloroflexi bacterium]|nr:molybdopterin molybdotransferase MoeA [Chloroflexota bacterium]